MHLREGEYDRAHTDFFEAFKVNISLNKFLFQLVYFWFNYIELWRVWQSQTNNVLEVSGAGQHAHEVRN